MVLMASFIVIQAHISRGFGLHADRRSGHAGGASGTRRLPGPALHPAPVIRPNVDVADKRASRGRPGRGGKKARRMG